MAIAAIERVIAGAADERVIASSTCELVSACAAGEEIVGGVAGERISPIGTDDAFNIDECVGFRVAIGGERDIEGADAVQREVEARACIGDVGIIDDVKAREAVNGIIARAAHESVGDRVAGEGVIARAAHDAFNAGECIDIACRYREGGERAIVEREAEAARYIAVIDGINATAAGNAVIAEAADERVIAGAAGDRVGEAGADEGHAGRGHRGAVGSRVAECPAQACGDGRQIGVQPVGVDDGRAGIGACGCRLPVRGERGIGRGA